MAYIYLITNNINDKVYVGKTEKSIQKRFKEHCTEALKVRCEKRPLYAAMRKHGIEHFSVELLEETLKPEEREVYWIEQKQSYRYGYNATRGGDGKKYLDYQLIYDLYKQVQNVTKTAKILGISVDSVSVAVKQFDKVKSAQEVSRETQSKQIIMCDLDGTVQQIFDSKHDAARYLQNNNITPTKKCTSIIVHINECISGKRKSAYKKRWCTIS